MPPRRSSSTRCPSERNDADSAQLAALGYTAKFDRSMSVWENFALGFTYLSPVVGVYSVFDLGLATGGPPMWWSYFLAAAGQFLVCLIFGEVVSQFPISGGLYPWARRLVGEKLTSLEEALAYARRQGRAGTAGSALLAELPGLRRAVAAAPDHAALRRTVLERYGKTLDLAEVG